MHECLFCTLTVGEEYNLVVKKGQFAICVICNADITGQYPKVATYQGKELRQEAYKHVFYNKTKIPCQSCGNDMVISTYDCHFDGEVVMLEHKGSQASEKI